VKKGSRKTILFFVHTSGPDGSDVLLYWGVYPVLIPGRSLNWSSCITQ